MEKLVREQNTLMTYISNFLDNTNRVGKDKQTQGYLQARVSLLNKYWDKFQLLNDQLLQTCTSEELEHDYFKMDFYTTAEIAYTEALGTLTDILKENEYLNNSNLSLSNQTLHECSQTQTNSCSFLEKIKIPRFGGDLREWPSFRDLFQSLVHTSTALSASAKFYHLKGSLYGHAEQLLRNTPISDANYNSAWKILCDRYQNKRLLVNANLKFLTSLPTMKTESAEELKRLHDGTIEAIKALEGLKRPVDQWDDWLVFITVQKLDPITRKDWESSISKDTELTDFKTLSSFLQNRINTLEAVGECNQKQKDLIKIPFNKFQNKPTALKAHAVTTGRCVGCSGKHILLFCPDFRQKSVLQRREFVSKHSLCFNCLRSNHTQSNCPSSNRCKHCNQAHHSTLHVFSISGVHARDTPIAKGTENSTPTCTESSCNQATTSNACTYRNSWNSTLLATAIVRLSSLSGRNITVRALLDQGSQATFISSSIAACLQLPKSRVNIPITGIGNTDAGAAKSAVEVKLQSCIDSDFELNIKALVLPKLTKLAALPRTIAFLTAIHLQGIKLADPDPSDNKPIDLLLGADYFYTILKQGLRRGQPTAQETTLDAAAKLDSLIQKFWEVEDNFQPAPQFSEEEQACLKLYKETTRRDKDGRYIVRLPIRPNYQDLMHFKETRQAAVRALLRMEHQFEYNDSFCSRYKDFMEEYFTLCHMEPVPENSTLTTTSRFYLPHHGVLKEDSATTKLRVVFNGSQKSKSGLSLYDCFSPGPKLQNDLRTIILRWRRHTIVFAADIAMMFRQIWIDEADRDLQRIVWRKDSSDNINEYHLRTVTYGITSAPYLSIRTLQQLADDEGSKFPLGAEILRNDFYVDDVLSGGDDLSEAIKIQQELTELLKSGGFLLHKWSSNHPQLIESFQNHSSPNLVNLDKDGIIKTLGLRWKTETGMFEFQVNITDSPQIVTKRRLLSDVSKLYDPLGFLAPTILLAKNFFQQLWLLKLEWDTPLPDSISQEWLVFRSELPKLEMISVPRWIGIHSASLSYEIHGFSDASDKAYAAVVYLRVIHSYENIQVSLLCAKTKLAPIKQLSIPRLELSGAHLLARLAHTVQSSLKLYEAPIFCWTDSQTVLTWLKAHPSRWKAFIANRVSTIHDLLPSVKWRHVPGSCNPAEGVKPSMLASHPLWWQGPSWLKGPSTSWPEQRFSKPDDNDLEERQNAATNIAMTTSPLWNLIYNYSSLNRLLRVTVYCQRFFLNAKVAPKNRTLGLPSASELSKALLFWIQHCQKYDFPEEYKRLSQGKSIYTTSALLRLTPYLDITTKAIRVGGRLQRAILPDEAKHQYLIGKESPLASLIINDAHQRCLHGGVQLTTSVARQKFWIPSCREKVRRLIRRCLVCFRLRASASNQLMGQLPIVRVTPSRPFQNTGLDYAGPILVRFAPGRGRQAYKAYIAIFVCMSTKAVHIELVSDLTTAAFLNAYKRFIARRGYPQKIYSDNGKTFVGANNELRKSWFLLNSNLPEELNSFVVKNGTTWIFIPPYSPNFGGLWEAGVKSAKHHLKRVISDTTLTFEELYTLLTQIEAYLNSRPLYPMSSDPNDYEVLTPGHFLIGTAPLTVPEPSLLSINPHRLSRWQLVQQMYEHFWRRWSSEYLNNLQVRNKWTTNKPNVKLGSLVLLRDDRLPPSQWAPGRIINIHPGLDGLVRVISVKTRDSTFKRSVNKVCPLPIPEDDTPVSNSFNMAGGLSTAATVFRP